MKNSDKRTLEEQLKNSIQILNHFSLEENKLRQAHVRAQVNLMTTDEKARYAQALSKQGLNQQQIADELDLSQPTVSGYLKRR